MKKVLVFGAFDGLHPGHIDFFRQAREHGDYLVVSIGTDENVTQIKGMAPLFSEEERKAVVEQLKCVDEVVIGEKENYYQGIVNIDPEVICLGYDQWATEEDVKVGLVKVGLGKVEVVRLSAYKENRAKSTFLKNKSVDF